MRRKSNFPGSRNEVIYQARTDTNRKLHNHIRQIQALGFDVTITRAA